MGNPSRALAPARAAASGSLTAHARRRVTDLDGDLHPSITARRSGTGISRRAATERQALARLYAISIPAPREGRAPGGADFQYPLSDRCDCNRQPRPLQLLGARSFSIRYRIDATATVPSPRPTFAVTCLSVSAIGSMRLQQRDRRGLLKVTATFSIRYRIDATATGGRGNAARRGSDFQYPLSDRCDCNMWNRSSAHRYDSLSVSAIGSMRLQPG
jgi:hypothetical protein